jgi:LuxR family transcriptional regulator, maltose regulon positive regulatory protein
MPLGAVHGRPSTNGGLVRRGRLIARLLQARDVPLVAVVAPAGYGKTSLLSDWLNEDDRTSIWVTLEDRHNDPTYLVWEMARALDGVEPIEPDLLGALAAGDPDMSGSLLSRLLWSLEERDDPLVMVLDDLHVLHTDESLGVLASVAEHLPHGSQLALASRAEPGLRLGRLRANRTLLELRAQDLAMDGAEASELLQMAGLELAPTEAQTLADHVEGWPAGLSLAALSLCGESDLETALGRFAGDDHVVADYLWDEFLAALPVEAITFLARSSILKVLHGPLCDAVLGRSGSAQLLQELAHGNLLLTPIDRSHEWYRCHRLLREALHGQLRRESEGCETDLHHRASAWYAAHGDLDSAIGHAVAARDPQRVGELLWENMPSYVTQGRNDLVQRWLGDFSAAEIAAHSPLAAVAAYSYLASGDIRQAEHWGMAAAGGLARVGTAETVASLPAGVAIIEAAVGRSGIALMGHDAARAYELEEDDSPWRSICCLFLGVADHLAGDRVHAREYLEEGVHRSAVQAPGIEALCLAQLTTIAIEEGDWEGGIALIDRAIGQLDRHGLEDHPTSALVFAVSAAVRSRVGNVDEGKRDLSRATHLMGMLNDFIPWYEAETRIALARAALRLTDVGTARTLLAEASVLARRVPDATAFRSWLDEVWEQIDTVATSTLAGTAALTMAELRILRFLPTHLTFREVAARLHVSTNTVKTQAHAVYRKLGACSRSQAVRRAREIGLLDA